MQSNYNLDMIPMKQHLLNNNKQAAAAAHNNLLSSNSTSNTNSVGSVRINKQLIQPLATNNQNNNNNAQLISMLPSKSTPSLASAYFPAASN